MNGLKKQPVPGASRRSDFIISMTMDADLTISGEITHSYSGQFQRFHSFLEMVLLMQSKMDETGFPQSSHEMRTWENKLIQVTAGRCGAYEK